MTIPGTMTPLSQLRQTIIAAHPGGKWQPNTCGCDRCSYCSSGNFAFRPIRLADVLIAMQKAWGQDKLKAREFYSAVDCWDLWHDSLDKQSPGTIAFLAKLLLP